MEYPETAQYPLLNICGLQFPGTALPISLGIWSFGIRLQRERHNHSRFPVTRDCVRMLLLVTHSVGYVWGVYDIIHQQQASATGSGNYALATLEFVTLTWGEGVLQESNFWAYTLTSWGWILLVLHPLAKATPPSSWNPWLSLMLSFPCAFQAGGRVNLEAVISGISLLGNAIFQLLDRGADPLRLYGKILAVLVPLCSAILVRPAAGKKYWFCDWFMKCSKHWPYPTESHMRCIQVGVSVIGLQAAGWILSSFLWSCFRWRWLFFGKTSRAPTLTVFSLAGGALYFAMYALNKILRRRAPTADIAVLVQNQLKDCFRAVQWTNSVYLGGWLLYESASIYSRMRDM